MNLCLTDGEHVAPQPVRGIARSYNVSHSTISRLGKSAPYDANSAFVIAGLRAAPHISPPK